MLVLGLSPAEVAGLVIGLLLGITFHEFSHALVADQLGDHRPRAMGRVSLNPLRHLDPLGTALLVLVGFGWGRPVLVNPSALRGGRNGMALVAAAGPVANVVMALGLALVFRAVEAAGLDGTAATILGTAVFLNLLLAILNFVPIPPLDGYNILLAFLPGAMGLHRPALRRVGDRPLDPAAGPARRSAPVAVQPGAALDARPAGHVMATSGIRTRVRQFVAHVTARVGEDEERSARALLPAAAYELFAAMPVADRRHALDVLAKLRGSGVTDPDVLAAALLHDAAKGRRLRLWHRVAVVLVEAIAPGRLGRLASADPKSWRHPFHLHVHHAELSARAAVDAGCSPRVAAFIHGTPAAPDAQLAAALRAADAAS